MIKVRFDNGITVTIPDGVLTAPTQELTALLDTLASTLPGYGSSRLNWRQDYNIARGIIEKIGAGRIVQPR